MACGTAPNPADIIVQRFYYVIDYSSQACAGQTMRLVSCSPPLLLLGCCMLPYRCISFVSILNNAHETEYAHKLHQHFIQGESHSRVITSQHCHERLLTAPCCIMLCLDWSAEAVRKGTKALQRRVQCTTQNHQASLKNRRYTEYMRTRRQLSARSAAPRFMSVNTHAHTTCAHTVQHFQTPGCHSLAHVCGYFNFNHPLMVTRRLNNSPGRVGYPTHTKTSAQAITLASCRATSQPIHKSHRRPCCVHMHVRVTAVSNPAMLSF